MLGCLKACFDTDDKIVSFPLMFFLIVVRSGSMLGPAVSSMGYLVPERWSPSANFFLPLFQLILYQYQRGSGLDYGDIFPGHFISHSNMLESLDIFSGIV